MENFPAAYGWTQRQVHYRSTLAREVSDLHATSNELVDVLGALDRLTAAADEPGDDGLTAAAMWTFAVTHYARLFAKGRRSRIDDHLAEALAAWPGSAREAHESFLGFRDKHLAHIVSDFDRAGVVVEIARRKHPQGTEWSWRRRLYAARVATAPSAQVQQLRELCLALAARVLDDLHAKQEALDVEIDHVPLPALERQEDAADLLAETVAPDSWKRNRR